MEGSYARQCLTALLSTISTYRLYNVSQDVLILGIHGGNAPVNAKKALWSTGAMPPWTGDIHGEL